MACAESCSNNQQCCWTLRQYRKAIKKAVSRSSPDCRVFFFARRVKKSQADSLIGPRVSTAIGWKWKSIGCQSGIFVYMFGSCLFCYWSCFSGNWGYIWVGQRANDRDVPDKRFTALPRNQCELIRAFSVGPTCMRFLRVWYCCSGKSASYKFIQNVMSHWSARSLLANKPWWPCEFHNGIVWDRAPNQAAVL